MSGAEQFVRAPLADPNMGVTLDPATGMPYATAGGTLLMYKVLATGTVALSEWIFVKWRQNFFQRRRQQQVGITIAATVANALALAIYPHTPGQSASEIASEAAFPLGFDFGRLEAQDNGQQLFKQLLDELKDMQAQMRAQQQNFERQFAQQEDRYNQREAYIQRLELGMDTRDQKKNEDIQQLRQQLQTKQAILDSQAQILEEILNNQDRRTDCIEHQETTDRTDKDRMREKFEAGDDSWQQALKPDDQRKPNDSLATPMYAIGTTTIINKAIDTWIKDYKAHGGIVSYRNVVDGQIIADWGVRVRRRLMEKGTESKGTTINHTTIKGG